MRRALLIGVAGGIVGGYVAYVASVLALGLPL